MKTRTLGLAAAMAAMITVPDTTIASTVTVFNCADSGAGSLRAAVALAGNGDTVDLTQLPAIGCSRVTLTTGQIVVNQNDLTLLGPASDVTISGKLGRNPAEVGRIFYHVGTGTFKLTHLNVRDGNLSGSNYPYTIGGCIFSRGTTYLLHSTVQACVAGGSAVSIGGGISTGTFIAKYSTVSGNSAEGPAQLVAGGGVRAYTATVKFSTISGNRAVGPANTVSRGGGAFVEGDSQIASSTISGNYATTVGGGLFLIHGPFTAVVTDSTISGNAADYVGGIYSVQNLTLQNSTVAFNVANHGSSAYAPGVAVYAFNDDVNVILQSSIIANNSYAGHNLDFGSIANLNGSVATSGSNNLIQKSFSEIPSGTLVNVCPRLGVLRDNGGPTRTHALLSGSAAIDAGNDLAIDPISHVPYADDQRNLPRVDHGAADIGAYEVQQGDIVFNDAFDGCS